MGTVNINDLENYGSSGQTDWLKLQDDGDIAKVQFMVNSMDEVDAFVCHNVKVENKDGKEYDAKVNCLRTYKDPIDMCPLCAAGIKVQPTIMLSFVDVESNSIKIWQRGKAFVKKLESLFNRYSPLTEQVFEIERQGKRGDQKTAYELFPTKDEPIDISGFEKPEFLGSVIQNRSAQEMEEYLETGAFPRKEQDDEEPTTRRRESSRRDSSEEAPRGSRRGASSGQETSRSRRSGRR